MHIESLHCQYVLAQELFSVGLWIGRSGELVILDCCVQLSVAWKDSSFKLQRQGGSCRPAGSNWRISPDFLQAPSWGPQNEIVVIAVAFGRCGSPVLVQLLC